MGHQKNSITVVEGEYVCEIPEPEDPMTRVRFSRFVGTHKIPAFFGVIMEDVRVVGPYGIPITRSGRVIVEPLSERWLPHVLGVTLKELGLVGFLREYLLAIWPLFSKSQAEVSNAAHLLCRGAGWQRGGRGPVYGHWFGEQIPQLRAIEAIQEKTKAPIKLLINRKPASWQIESLEMLGYDANTLIEHSRPGVRVRHLVISSLRNVHSRGMELDPKARRWGAERIGQSVSREARKHAREENVAYLRTNQSTRTVANMGDLRNVLSQSGFVEDKDLPTKLANVVSITKGVKRFLVVGGSSVFRMMFSDHPETLTEITPPGFYPKEFCFLLSFELGARFNYLPSLEVPTGSDMLLFWQGNRDPSGIRSALYVPPATLRATLEST